MSQLAAQAQPRRVRAARLLAGWGFLVSAGQEEEKPQPAGQERVECYVCFEDKLPSEVSQNRCGHVFCNACWALHLAETNGDGTLHNYSTTTCSGFS